MSYDKLIKLADKFYGKYFEKKALETFKSDPYKKDEASDIRPALKGGASR